VRSVTAALSFALVVVGVSARSLAAGDFASATGWAEIRPDMKLAEARAALDRMHIKYGQRMRGKPPHWLMLTRDDGWHGTLYLDDEDRINDILFTSSHERASYTRAEAEQLMAGYRARFGPPQATRRVDGKDGGKDGDFVEIIHTWANDHVVLEVTMHESPHVPDDKKWLLSEAWMSLRQARLNGKAPAGR
jgi:hypothetical protein